MFYNVVRYSLCGIWHQEYTSTMGMFIVGLYFYFFRNHSGEIQSSGSEESQKNLLPPLPENTSSPVVLFDLAHCTYRRGLPLTHSALKHTQAEVYCYDVATTTRRTKSDTPLLQDEKVARASRTSDDQTNTCVHEATRTYVNTYISRDAGT